MGQLKTLYIFSNYRNIHLLRKPAQVPIKTHTLYALKHE